jgi:hypothetical protein
MERRVWGAVAIAEHCTLTPLTLCLPGAMLNLEVGVEPAIPLRQ